MSSKIHLAVDGRGLPMSVTVTGGQAGDNPQVLPLLDQISVQREGPGRPDGVLADKAYSHPHTRKEMRKRGIAFTSPEKSDQVSRRKAKGSAGGAEAAGLVDVKRGLRAIAIPRAVSVAQIGSTPKRWR